MMKLRMQMLQFERRNENDRIIALYKAAESPINLTSITDRAERTRTGDIHGNNHEYEDISCGQSQGSRSHSGNSTSSNDSCKLDVDYLSPVSALGTMMNI